MRRVISLLLIATMLWSMTIPVLAKKEEGSTCSSGGDSTKIHLHADNYKKDITSVFVVILDSNNELKTLQLDECGKSGKSGQYMVSDNTPHLKKSIQYFIINGIIHYIGDDGQITFKKDEGTSHGEDSTQTGDVVVTEHGSGAGSGGSSGHKDEVIVTEPSNDPDSTQLPAETPTEHGSGSGSDHKDEVIVTEPSKDPDSAQLPAETPTEHGSGVGSGSDSGSGSGSGSGSDHKDEVIVTETSKDPDSTQLPAETPTEHGSGSGSDHKDEVIVTEPSKDPDSAQLPAETPTEHGSGSKGSINYFLNYLRTGYDVKIIVIQDNLESVYSNDPYSPDDIFDITYESDSDYAITSIKRQFNKETAVTQDTTIWSDEHFEGINGDITYIIETKRQRHVTVSSDNPASFSSTVKDYYIDGDDVTINFAPTSGYRITNIAVVEESENITLIDNVVSIMGIDQDYTINVTTVAVPSVEVNPLVTRTVSPTLYTLTLTSSDGGRFTLGSGVLPFDAGTRVFLELVADEGYEFVGYSEDSNSADIDLETNVIIMNGNKKLEAIFRPITIEPTIIPEVSPLPVVLPEPEVIEELAEPELILDLAETVIPEAALPTTAGIPMTFNILIGITFGYTGFKMKKTKGLK